MKLPTADQIQQRGKTAAFTVRVRVEPDGSVFIEKPPGAVGPTVPLHDLAEASAWLSAALHMAYRQSRRTAKASAA